MHMSWLRYIGGRLKSDYRYSIGIVYNPFPWPDARARIRDLAQAVLDARSKFPGATMADLYDADVMKPELLRAHRALDAAVDKLYRAEPFDGDRQRVEHLFTRYEKLIAPLTSEVAASRAVYIMSVPQGKSPKIHSGLSRYQTPSARHLL